MGRFDASTASRRQNGLFERYGKEHEMSDEVRTPDEDEVEAHGQPVEGQPVEGQSVEAHDDEDSDDVVAHGLPVEGQSVEGQSVE
jgi:hypothetical protein